MMTDKILKLKLVKIWEILSQETDEEHPMGTTELLCKLNSLGIVCDRRTLYADIDALNECGYEILCRRSTSNNRLWWTIFFGLFINILTVDLIALFERIDTKKLNLKKVMKSMLPSFTDPNTKEEKELLELKQSFYEENIVDLLINIRCLKISPRYADLGDYYLAISYLFGLTPNTISPEMKSAMGIEMLMIFETLGNIYAKRMLGTES